MSFRCWFGHHKWVLLLYSPPKSYMVCSRCYKAKILQSFIEDEGDLGV